MTSVQRLPRPAEIAEAAEYVFGESVHHEGSSSRGRVYAAKCAYWQALVAVGYSQAEIATMTGANRKTIINGLAKPVDPEHLAWIVEKASSAASSTM